MRRDHERTMYLRDSFTIRYVADVCSEVVSASMDAQQGNYSGTMSEIAGNLEVNEGVYWKERIAMNELTFSLYCVL